MDYPLLLLFIGQVVLVAALVRTGLPSQLWEATIDTWCRTSPSGTASCATALSNVISNVPFVLMVTPSLARPSGLAAAASVVAATAADALSEADSNDMNVDEVVSLRWSYSYVPRVKSYSSNLSFPPSSTGPWKCTLWRAGCGDMIDWENGRMKFCTRIWITADP